MSAEGQAKIYDMVAEKIVSILEKGVVPWRKPWGVKGRKGVYSWPRNLASKRPYRGINVFILDCQGHSSRWWLSFKQISDRGGSIRKGEKGTVVVFWKPIEIKERQDDGTVAKKTIPLLRYYHVWNLSQVDGIADPDAADTDDSDGDDRIDPIDAAEAIVAGMPNAPQIVNGGNVAAYSPILDVIKIPDMDAFSSAAEFYSTLFHEMTHSTGHKSRLARPSVVEPARYGSDPYAKEELVAEMGAAFLCGHAGIVNETVENSAAYIGNWIRKIKEEPKIVVHAAAAAQKAADFILAADKGSGDE